MAKTIEERFWAKVNKTTDCWIWVASRNVNGYGFFSIGQGNVMAHRLSWEMFHKKKIPHGMVVMHKCDTPACVNPLHLEIGTQRDNMGDMAKKGRSMSGEKNNKATLSNEAVRQIRLLCSEKKLTQKAIGAMFGVRYETVNKINSGIYRPHG